MKKKIAICNRMIGFLLSVVLMFESFGMNASAAAFLTQTDSNMMDYMTVSGEISGGDADDSDVSGNVVSSEDVVSDGNVVSDGDVVSDGNVVSSGDVVSDGNVVSDGDVVSDGNVVSNGDVARDEVVALSENAAATEKIFASGTYYGMDWTINTDGMLAISGKYDGAQPGRSWTSYASRISSAKVTATDVGSTYKWFADLSELKTVDLSGFNSGKVLDASYMFFNCSSLEKIKFGNIKTYNTADMSYMFYGCESLKNLDLSGFNTAKVTNMRYMFAKCSSLAGIDVSAFDTSKVTDMTGMFYGCSKATSISTNKFDTANVTDMSSMFEDCGMLKKVRVEKFKTDKVVNMSSMFQNCSKVTIIDVSGFKTQNVKYMSAMFSGCSALTSLDLRAFNTSSVTSMSHMFSECLALKKINLSNFMTYYVTDMDGMFFKCYQLQKLDLSTFSMSKVTSADAMIGRCGSLKQVKTPTNLKINVDLPFEMKTSSGERYTSLPQNMRSVVELEHITYDIEVIEDQEYTGSAIKPKVTVTKDEEVLTQDVDYTVSYTNNIKAATAASQKAPTVIVKGKGRFAGTITRTFSINAKEITDENAVIKEMIFEKTGKVQKKVPTITVDGVRLKAKKDFVVTYPDTTSGAYKNPGQYNVVIEGIGNYTGEIRTTMVILDGNQIKASELKVASITPYTYVNGRPATPTPKISYKGKALKLNEDYELSYKNNDKAGTATLVITGLENEEGQYVCGTLEKSFKIKGTSLKKATVNYTKKVTYTGYGIYPELELSIGETILEPKRDYTVKYSNNVNVGKASITITGCGGYTGVIKKNFNIQPDIGVGDLLDISLADEDGCVEYTKNGAKPKVVVKLDDKELQEGIDYKLKYLNNTIIATADSTRAPTIEIKGVGNYSFKRNIKFTVQEKSLGDADITISVSDKVIADTDLRSKPVITDHTGTTLIQNKDYKIVGYTIGGVAYDKNNIPEDATRGIVTVKGIGGYTGEVSVMYRIAEKSIRKVNVIAKNLEFNGSSVEYTSELITFGALVVTDKSTGMELVYGEDYEIFGYKKNTKKGYATVIIKGLGDYGGTKNVGFKIVSQRLD